MTPSQPETAADIPCPHCGGAIKSGATICKHCKEAVPAVPTALPPHAAVAPTTQGAPLAPPSKAGGSPMEGRLGWVIVGVMVLAIGVYAAVRSGILSGSSNWKLQERKSEMSDSVRHGVVTESPREVTLGSLSAKPTKFHPFLSVGFEDGVTEIRTASGETINFTDRGAVIDGKRVRTGTLKVRFDEDEAVDAKMVELPSTGGAVAIGPEGELLRNMLKHKVVKIQWERAFGAAVVDTFNVEGLQDALLNLCGKAPEACKSNTTIAGALRSVGVEIKGERTTTAPQASPAPAPAPPTPAAPRPGEALALPPGKFAASTPQWTSARDAVVAWCGANAGKCTEEAVELLKNPADGLLQVGGGTSATLTTCSLGNCPTGTFVQFTRSGTAWSVTGVELSQLGE